MMVLKKNDKDNMKANPFFTIHKIRRISNMHYIKVSLCKFASKNPVCPTI